MQLADDKKIRLMYRIEPGCLAPYYGQFLFLPRFDKQKDERQYSVKNRNLSRVQAKAYLNHFEIDIDTFEEQLDELLTKAIDLYFKR